MSLLFETNQKICNAKDALIIPESWHVDVEFS